MIIIREKFFKFCYIRNTYVKDQHPRIIIEELTIIARFYSYATTVWNFSRRYKTKNPTKLHYSVKDGSETIHAYLILNQVAKAAHPISSIAYYFGMKLSTPFYKIVHWNFANESFFQTGGLYHSWRNFSGRRKLDLKLETFRSSIFYKRINWMTFQKRQIQRHCTFFINFSCQRNSSKRHQNGRQGWSISIFHAGAKWIFRITKHVSKLICSVGN